MRLTRIARVPAILVGAFALALAPALSASADDSSTTTFDPSATQTVSYGTNWLMTLKVAGTEQYDFVTATSGTVNILIKGIPGNYVTGLPVTDGGEVFFSPPSSQPPLPAGTYQVSAVYVPSGTAYLAPSQTATPATLTITPLVLPSAFSVNKATIDNNPSLEVVATVSPPNANAAIPAGTWLVTAKDSAGMSVFEKTVALAKNPADPITVPLGSKVKPGRTYTIAAQFLPAPSVAGGYQVKQGTPKTVTVEAQSLGEVLAKPLAVPVWALILVGLGLALLIATAIVLLVTGKPKTSGTLVDAPPATTGEGFEA
jgi:hypothetical protein